MNTLQKLDRDIKKAIDEGQEHKRNAIMANDPQTVRSEITKCELSVMTAEALLEIRENLMKKVVHFWN